MTEVDNMAKESIDQERIEKVFAEILQVGMDASDVKKTIIRTYDGLVGMNLFQDLVKIKEIYENYSKYAESKEDVEKFKVFLFGETLDILKLALDAKEKALAHVDDYLKKVEQVTNAKVFN